MGNSNTSEKETYSSTQEVIEINKLVQQYLSILFKDDNLAIRDYNESMEEFMFRSRPSIYLFDKLTFEQKKILVNEFYNINQELKYKLLNTKDKLKYLQQYELAYKQCGGVTKYSNNTGLNLNIYNSKLENERLKLENERLKLENEALKLDIKIKKSPEVSVINTPLFSNTKNNNIKSTELEYEKIFENNIFNDIKKQTNKINYHEIIKIYAHKLADWDNNVFGNIPRNLVYKSPVHYKDMLEYIINNKLNIDYLLILICDLYNEIDNLEKKCYQLNIINESELMLMLNEIIIKDKYYKNSNIIQITEKFIPQTLGVRGETLRHGPTLWSGVENYVRIIKQRISIFIEFYHNVK